MKLKKKLKVVIKTRKSNIFFEIEEFVRRKRRLWVLHCFLGKTQERKSQKLKKEKLAQNN